MEISRIYHGGGRNRGGMPGAVGPAGPAGPAGLPGTPGIDWNSAFIPAVNFASPTDTGAGKIATWRDYAMIAGNAFAFGSWEMQPDTDDPIVHAPFVFPPLADLTQEVTLIPYFALDSVGTGTGIRFDCGVKLIPDVGALDGFATVDRQDTVVAPAIQTCYYGTPHVFVPFGTAGLPSFANIRVRRIYGGSDAPANQWTGTVYFLGVFLSWGY